MYAQNIPRQGTVWQSTPVRQYDEISNARNYGQLPGVKSSALAGLQEVKFIIPDMVREKGLMDRYTVVMTSLAAGNFPGQPSHVWSLGNLADRVRLPLVNPDPNGYIGVLPDTMELPTFQAKLVPGGTYFIPEEPFSKPGGPNTKWNMFVAGKSLGLTA
jgi:hypothetical protein